MVGGLETFPALSTRAAQQINQRCPANAPKPVALFRRHDARYHTRAQGPGQSALSAARTGQDVLTSGLANTRAGVAARISGPSGNWLSLLSRFSVRVQVQVLEGGSVFAYAEMMAAQPGRSRHRRSTGRQPAQPSRAVEPDGRESRPPSAARSS